MGTGHRRSRASGCTQHWSRHPSRRRARLPRSLRECREGRWRTAPPWAYPATSTRAQILRAVGHEPTLAQWRGDVTKTTSVVALRRLDEDVLGGRKVAVSWSSFADSSIW